MINTTLSSYMRSKEDMSVLPDVCKFCGFVFAVDNPCYNGDEPCGAQMCPACFSCQKRTDNDDPGSIQSAKFTRRLREESGALARKMEELSGGASVATPSDLLTLAELRVQRAEVEEALELAGASVSVAQQNLRLAVGVQADLKAKFARINYQLACGQYKSEP